MRITTEGPEETNDTAEMDTGQANIICHCPWLQKIRGRPRERDDIVKNSWRLD